MLNFEQRLALLEKKLEKVTADELFERLQKYEAKGPLAGSFLGNQSNLSKYTFHNSSDFIDGFLTVKRVVYIQNSSDNYTSCNDDFFSNTVLAA